MDSYYQQGGSQQQQQHQSAHGQQQQVSQQQLGGRADLVGMASAPPMQSSVGLHQSQMMNQQTGLPQGVSSQHHQSSGHSGRSAAGYQQQQQTGAGQPLQQSSGQLQNAAAYPMDSQSGYGPASQNALGASSGSHRTNGMGSHHHHGGQPPLPPGVHSGGGGGREHQPSGRYTSHRQAALHQHRSSAAAISDPMMGATITDHLASASGPLTGSGSALNQLGGYGGGGGGGFAGAYPGSRQDPMLGYQGSQQPAALDAVYPGGGPLAPQPAHQSRYDGHYLRGQSRHTPAGSYAAGTMSGAYHLDRADLASDPRYYPSAGQSQAALHQSLGHLPSMSGRQEHASARYGLGGGDSMLQDRYQFERAGSMPPLTTTEGLGSYNPLDDPLAVGGHSSRLGHQLHHQQTDPLHLQPGFGPNPFAGGAGGPGNNRDMYITELRARLQEAQNSYAAVKRELETATQKLGSSMHSIKSFWSPELKKERALRKEEATRNALVNDQMKLMRVEIQKQALLIRQLEDELRLAHETRIRTTDPDIQQHIDALCMEKEGLFKENCLLRETIRELEMRLETQKQTLAARDDSIRKMVEMMNNKGIATKIMEDERMEMDRIKTRNIELEARLRHYETIIEAKEKDIIKSDSCSSQQTRGSLSTSLSLHDTTIKRNPLADTNSPVPRQRKTKPSKAERLKSRLANKNSALPSKERLNDMIIQATTSSSLSSSTSSSGVSSSKSSDELTAAAATQVTVDAGEQQPLDESNNSVQQQQPDTTSAVGNRWQESPAYRLCRCPDCMQSGQQIYSMRRPPVAACATSTNPQRAQQRATRAPTPPRLAPRKAVSFRSSVEHIGSPRSGRPMSLGRLVNHEPTQNLSLETGASGRLARGWSGTSESGELEESCDSMHCTKDLSLCSQATTAPDDDYLQPLDCSTPKNSAAFHGPVTGSASLDRRASSATRRLVRAEVHQPPMRPPLMRADYTCLCSPDMLCIHNYPQLEAPATTSASAATAEPQARSASNELYGTTASDFQLSSGCVDCKNLSTYVNLSATRRNKQGFAQHRMQPQSMDTSQTMGGGQENSLGGGYGSVDYRRQLKLSRQNHVYGNFTSAPLMAAPDTEEQMHYLSAARRLQQSLSDCELCKRQLGLVQCSCHPPLAGNGTGNSFGEPQQQPTCDLSGTTKSYHTANSSSMLLNPHRPFINGLNNGNGCSHAPDPTSLALMNAGELSVLPVTSSSTLPTTTSSNSMTLSDSRQQQQQPVDQLNGFSMNAVDGASSNQALNTGNGIDSSLSSLFVYRHVSDDNQAPGEDEFDPDSLELSRSQSQQQLVEQKSNTVARQQAAAVPATSASWLKARPPSEYISLSSTTSSLSTGGPRAASGKLAAGGGGNNNSIKSQSGDQLRMGGSSGATPTVAHNRSHSSSKSSLGLTVGSDLTQSSLAKRRHLSHLSLQQQQLKQPQQQPQVVNCNGKRKPLAGTKSSSRSSPNLANSGRSSSRNNNTSSGSNNTSSSSKLSIYQCFKNHLLDITKSHSSNSSVHKLGSSASLPRNLTSSLSSKSGARLSHPKSQMEELRAELAKRDQELLTMNAKMKALDEQQRDSQHHIRVLKDSLVAKQEHYNLLLRDVEDLKRNLDDRNKLIEKKSFQQTMGADPRLKGYASSYQEVQEMQSLLEMRDKKINEMQRRVLQLDGLLAERDAQLERARVRFEHPTSSGPNHHQDTGLLNHLEESLGDKERQISMIRDQRDRAEHELNEERDSHERSIKEYKMKLNSLKFEMDKLQNRLNKTSMFEGKYGSNAGDLYTTSGANDRFGSGDQTALIKRLELDKRSLQLECERLKDKLDSSTSGSLERRRMLGAGSGSVMERASSALGDYSVVEFERLQEALEAQKQELRRAQAECRMNEMERKRAQEEADKLSERYERTQAEMHKLKAKLENATSEREQLLEDYERQQQLISKSQTERDCALADINQLKMDNERLQQNFNKNLLQAEKLQAQVERTQLEYKKLEDRFNEASDELRHLQSEKSSAQRELKTLEMNLQSAQMQQQRLQQERDLIRQDLEKVREKHDRLEAELERFLHDKELNQQQVAMYKERMEGQQQQASKMAKEREQLSMEIHELRERLHKQQKLQDTSELETRNEVRLWKEKYERLLVQFEKMNQDMVAKEKESQMVMDKLQRVQSEAVKLESKLEQSEMDRERTVIEVEKLQQLNNKAKEEYKKWQDELQQLQEMYTKTNTKLLNLSEVEEKLRIDYDKCQMDLEVLRERYEKLQLESRKLQSERDRLQVEHERIRFDNKRIQQSQGSQQASQEEFIRLSSEVDRLVAKLEQYQREMNKLQLEKERLILDGKSMVQQTEQQYQQQLVKVKSSEEKAIMELERTRMQLEKVQSKHEQVNIDQEKLVGDKERLQQQLMSLQQEVDKFRSQQSSSVQETKKLHDEELQRILQELEIIREKYTQQRKELLQLRELQQTHEIDKDELKHKLESTEQRLEKLNQSDSKQRQDSERCMIEIEKMKDKIERKQQELARTQKERDQFAQEITVLHRQIQQLQLQYDQLQKQTPAGGGQQPAAQQQQQQQQQQPSQQQQPPFKPEELNKLKQMLVKSENDLQKTMAENQRFQMEVERLRLQLDDAAEYINKVEETNKLLSKQNQEIIQQLKQVQQQQAGGNQPQQQQQAASQQQQEAMQQEMKKMQDVIKKSAHEIQKMVEERNKMHEQNKELQRNLEQSKVEFNSTMDQYEAELQRLQQEAQQRQQQQQQQQGGNSSQPQQPPSDEFKIKFEKAVEAIRAFQKSSDSMKNEIIKLNERNKSISDQNQSLIQSLKSAEESLKKKGGDESGASSAGDKSRPEEPPEVRQKLAQLTELCGKLERDLGRSQEETQKNQQANQLLKQILDKSQSEMTNLKTERDRFQAQLEKLMVELERREDEMANLQSQQEKSGQNLQTKQNELVSYQRQLDEREKALEAKREELQNLSKQLQQQQRQPPAAANQPQQQQQQLEMIAKLQQQIKGLEDERNKLKGELERVRNELKQSQAEVNRLLTILTASEEEKMNLMQQIEQLQAKLKSMPGAGSGPQQGQQMPKGPPPTPQQQQQAAAAAAEQQRVQQQQRQGQPPHPQQRPPAQQAPQQKPANQGQRPSGGGASGFISGLFQ